MVIELLGFVVVFDDLKTIVRFVSDFECWSKTDKSPLNSSSWWRGPLWFLNLVSSKKQSVVRGFIGIWVLCSYLFEFLCFLSTKIHINWCFRWEVVKTSRLLLLNLEISWKLIGGIEGKVEQVFEENRVKKVRFEGQIERMISPSL